MIANDYLSALNVNHPDVNLMSDPTLTGYANNAANSGQSVSDFVNKYNNDPSVYGAYTQKYQTIAAPQGAQINQDYNNTGFQIKQGANEANNTVLNTAAGSGLQRSGFAALGQNTVGTQENQALNYNEANRANNLANLALTTNTNVQQDYNQDNATMYNREQNLFTDAQSLPFGRSVQVGPGFNVQGTQSDPAGFTTALTSLLPIANSAGGSSIIASILPALAQQYGVQITGSITDALNNYKPASTASTTSTGINTLSKGGGVNNQNQVNSGKSNPPPASHTLNDLEKYLNTVAFPQGKNVNNFEPAGWTENTLLPAINSKYGSLGEVAINKAVYSVRKANQGF